MVEQALAKVLPQVIGALPKASGKPKVTANAPGLLAQLGTSVGVAGDDKDTDNDVEEISDAETEAGGDEEVAVATAVPFAVAARAPQRAQRATSQAPSSGSGALRERLATHMLAQSALYGSLQAWARMVQFNTLRNRNECEAIAQGVDALLKEGVPATSTGVEILLRRLAGVHMADQSGTWGVADAISWTAHGGSLLPRNVMRAAYKDAEVIKRAQGALTTAPRAAFKGAQGAHAGGSGARSGAPDTHGNTAARSGFKWSNKDNKPAQGKSAPASEDKGAARA